MGDDALNGIGHALEDMINYEIDGVPVYQSRNNGMLFAEDATPLTWYGDKLCDLVRLARGLIMIKGPSEELEECLREMKSRKERFSRVLEREHAN